MLAGPAQLDALEARIDAWLREELEANPTVAAVDRGEPGERRWYVRLRGEEKDTFTVWFTLRQRTLHYETYVMPAPEENERAFYEHLLRRNAKLFGAAFTIGQEDAVFLVGQLPVASIDEAELDRILGSMYAYVERCFRPALRIGFASRMAAR
ncbi:MAG: YbjN domain-containing protein [Acidimicrobiales bacterium]